MPQAVLKIGQVEDVSGAPDEMTVWFATPAALLEGLTARRLAVLGAMTPEEATSVRDVAKRTSRDVKAVHRDMAALVAAGLLTRDDSGRMRRAYSGLRIDAELLPQQEPHA